MVLGLAEAWQEKVQKVKYVFSPRSASHAWHSNELTGDHKDRPYKPNSTYFSRYSGTIRFQA